jgi:3'(2'), 5'-bisphosphate nucleotidase
MNGPNRPPADAGDAQLAETLGRIALKAAAIVMGAYDAHVPIRVKADASPVCEADERSEAFILEELAAHFPAIPVLAEESISRGVVPPVGGEFFLVDPLDGTREFAARNGEFTVNIALIRNGVPVCGAVSAPVMGRLWIGSPGRALHVRAKAGDDLPSSGEPVAGRPCPADPVAYVSRSSLDPLTERWLADRRIANRVPMGSSVKFCLLASGEADVYPRFGPTMEWDTAAGDAVLRAAGGCVVDENGAPLRYGKAAENFRNPHFIAWTDPTAAR